MGILKINVEIDEGKKEKEETEETAGTAGTAGKKETEKIILGWRDGADKPLEIVSNNIGSKLEVEVEKIFKQEWREIKQKMIDVLGEDVAKTAGLLNEENWYSEVIAEEDGPYLVISPKRVCIEAFWTSINVNETIKDLVADTRNKFLTENREIDINDETIKAQTIKGFKKDLKIALINGDRDLFHETLGFRMEIIAVTDVPMKEQEAAFLDEFEETVSPRLLEFLKELKEDQVLDVMVDEYEDKTIREQVLTEGQAYYELLERYKHVFPRNVITQKLDKDGKLVRFERMYLTTSVLDTKDRNTQVGDKFIKMVIQSTYPQGKSLKGFEIKNFKNGICDVLVLLSQWIKTLTLFEAKKALSPQGKQEQLKFIESEWENILNLLKFSRAEVSINNGSLLHLIETYEHASLEKRTNEFFAIELFLLAKQIDYFKNAKGEFIRNYLKEDGRSNGDEINQFLLEEKVITLDELLAFKKPQTKILPGLGLPTSPKTLPGLPGGTSKGTSDFDLSSIFGKKKK